MKKKEGYRFSKTYYCPKCKMMHHKRSRIGQNHWKYRRKGDYDYDFQSF